jgi:hypothetical protein
MRPGISACALALLLLGSAASCAAKEVTEEEVLLDALLGRWRMVGTVHGDAVTYDMTAERVLGGRWVRLHMKDVKRPPGYEANVYLAWDFKAQRVVAHWIDTFGAAPSTTLGYGNARGQVLELRFDYPDGAFRDRFTWEPAKKRWRFLIESAKAGGYETFGDYVVTKTGR